MKRRMFLAGTATALATPYVLRAQMASYNPPFQGKRVRRRLSTLNDDDPFFASYAKAIDEMHKLPDDNVMSWMYQARLHANFCEHGTIEFFTWHRPYVSYFEQMCAKLSGNSEFALPYWDWPDDNGRMPAPFWTDGPLNVMHWTDNGVYIGSAKWPDINTVPHRFSRADFGMSDGPFAGDFAAAKMKAMEDAANFGLLSSLTEGPHGLTHIFNGGWPPSGLGTLMGHFSSGLSPLEPFFWCHHSNVDRVWAQSAIPVASQKAAVGSPGKVYSGMFFDADGNAASPTLDSTFDMTQWDYIYDFMEASLLSPEMLAFEQQLVRAQPMLMDFATGKGLRVVDTAAEPRVIASSGELGETRAGAVNTVSVRAEGLVDLITSDVVVPQFSILAENAVAVSGPRVYAKFTNVRPAPDAENQIIKVFVDAPLAGPDTPTTDPHYAGSINFFGCNPDVCGPLTFTVDITDALKYQLSEGRVSPDGVQLQLIAAGEGGGVVADHGDVELITL